MEDGKDVVAPLLVRRGIIVHGIKKSTEGVMTMTESNIEIFVDVQESGHYDFFKSRLMLSSRTAAGPGIIALWYISCR